MSGEEKNTACALGNQSKTGASPPKWASRQTVTFIPACHHLSSASLRWYSWTWACLLPPTLCTHCCQSSLSKMHIWYCHPTMWNPPSPPPSTSSSDRGQMPNMAYRVPLNLLLSLPSTSLLNFIFLQSPLRNSEPSRLSFISSKGRSLALLSLASAWNGSHLLAVGSSADCPHPSHCVLGGCPFFFLCTLSTS